MLQKAWHTGFACDSTFGNAFVVIYQTHSDVSLQLLALEDMGVKAEDLVTYSQVEVRQLH
jgi:hypothetical protein